MTALLTNGGYSPNLVQAYASRMLRLLQEIESGREFLDANVGMLKTMIGSTASLVEQLRAQDANAVLDPEGKVSELLSQAAESARRSREVIQARHAAAQQNKKLTSELDQAFAQFSDVAAEIHNTIEDMREWVETHDALLEQPSGRPMKSAAELFSRLGIGNAA